MVTPSDVLFVSRPGRLLHERLDGVLILFYDEKEITFDEPELIPFGEQLLKETRFVAESARSWSPAGYPWETIKELCETLMVEGLLSLEEPARVERIEQLEGKGTIAGARTWTAESCESLSREIYGVPIEVGNLESLVRCVRIAHSALDAGGRQLGEKNVFPEALALDLPRKVRTCPYRGSRFEHELPMNMTGLDPVIKHWRDVLEQLRSLKAEFWRRRPQAKSGFNVVDLYLLGTIALSIPAYAVQCTNAPLSLEISAFFRVMDGTRIAPRHMLLNLHPAFAPDVVPTAEQLHRYADRELLMIAESGVCAGPPQMIQAFFEAVVGIEDGATAPCDERAVTYAVAAAEIEALSDLFWVREHGRLEEAGIEIDPELVGYSTVPPDSDRGELEHMFIRVIQQCREMRGGVHLEIGDVFTRMAECQAECNRVLGRAPPARPWTERELAKVWPRHSLLALRGG